MVYKGTSHEFLLLTEINAGNKDLVFGAKDTELTLLWNTGAEMNISIDKVKYQLAGNEIIFLTEFHQIDLNPFCCPHLIGRDRCDSPTSQHRLQNHFLCRSRQIYCWQDVRSEISF